MSVLVFFLLKKRGRSQSGATVDSGVTKCCFQHKYGTKSGKKDSTVHPLIHKTVSEDQ